MNANVDRLRSVLPARYVLEHELGAGSFAIGYQAQDRAADRKVVLKVLRPEIAATIDRDRFLAEIRAATELQHPNIIAVYDAGQAGEFLYFVRPFVEGESLRDWLDRETQLSLDDAMRVTREVADAMGFAHSHGVPHGDLRPENILLRDGHAVVGDFGVERAVFAAAADNLAGLANIVDTSSYMSPEQFRGPRQLDERSDVFSLGCVLYEMLAGQPPSHAAPEGDGAGGTGSPPPVTDFRPGVPPEVVSALDRALAGDPERRFGTAGQFCEDLRVVRLSTGKFALLKPTPWYSGKMLGTLLLVVFMAIVALIMWL